LKDLKLGSIQPGDYIFIWNFFQLEGHAVISNGEVAVVGRKKLFF